MNRLGYDEHGHDNISSGLRYEYNPVCVECLTLLITPASTWPSLARKKRIKGSEGSVMGHVRLGGSFLLPYPPSPTPGTKYHRKGRRGNWYLRFCLNSSLLVCIQIIYSGFRNFILPAGSSWIWIADLCSLSNTYVSQSHIHVYVFLNSATLFSQLFHKDLGSKYI